MKLDEARAECERWLAYLDRQKARAEELAKIAAARRRGEMELHEARIAMCELDTRAPVVYDGANLEKAVRRLLTASQEDK